jgi:hypothetical protein
MSSKSLPWTNAYEAIALRLKPRPRIRGVSAVENGGGRLGPAPPRPARWKLGISEIMGKCLLSDKWLEDGKDKGLLEEIWQH